MQPLGTLADMFLLIMPFLLSIGRLIESIIVRLPSDVVAIKDSTAVIQCYTNLSIPVMWQKSLGAGGWSTIYQGDPGYITSTYKDEISVSVDSTSNQYNLIIRDVQMEDAGTYRCGDNMGFGLWKCEPGLSNEWCALAELVVIKDKLECFADELGPPKILTRPSLDGPPDLISMNCSVTYRGNIKLGLMWSIVSNQPSRRDSSPDQYINVQLFNQSIPSEDESSSTIITSEINIRAQGWMTGAHVRCHLVDVSRYYAADYKLSNMSWSSTKLCISDDNPPLASFQSDMNYSTLPTCELCSSSNAKCSTTTVFVIFLAGIISAIFIEIALLLSWRAMQGLKDAGNDLHTNRPTVEMGIQPLLPIEGEQSSSDISEVETGRFKTNDKGILEAVNLSHVGRQETQTDIVCDSSSNVGLTSSSEAQESIRSSTVTDQDTVLQKNAESETNNYIIDSALEEKTQGSSEVMTTKPGENILKVSEVPDMSGDNNVDNWDSASNVGVESSSEVLESTRSSSEQDSELQENTEIVAESRIILDAAIEETSNRNSYDSALEESPPGSSEILMTRPSENILKESELSDNYKSRETASSR